jgi:hypothetical protein
MEQHLLATPPAPFAAGMLTERGRVIAIEGDTLVVATETGVERVPGAGLALDLDDEATYLLALSALGERTGLDPSGGLLWHLSDEDMLSGARQWVLEDAEEVRMRDGDTEDPRVALARGLEETI